MSKDIENLLADIIISLLRGLFFMFLYNYFAPMVNLPTFGYFEAIGFVWMIRLLIIPSKEIK